MNRISSTVLVAVLLLACRDSGSRTANDSAIPGADSKTVPVGSQPQSTAPSTAAWITRLTSRYDPLFAQGTGDSAALVPARQDRFLARMMALPTEPELGKQVVDRAHLTSWESLLFALAAYDPLWKNSTLDSDRLATLGARARDLTLERTAQWQTSLSAATHGEVGAALAAILVLDTDEVFAGETYSETAGTSIVGRLAHVPHDSVVALSDAVGLSPSEAAMSIASADFAFNGSDFQSAAFSAALETLRSSLPAEK